MRFKRKKQKSISHMLAPYTLASNEGNPSPTPSKPKAVDLMPRNPY
jgi:hypothetical protein